MKENKITKRNWSIFNMIFKAAATAPGLFSGPGPAAKHNNHNYLWSGGSKTFKKNKRKGL